MDVHPYCQTTYLTEIPLLRANGTGASSVDVASVVQDVLFPFGFIVKEHAIVWQEK